MYSVSENVTSMSEQYCLPRTIRKIQVSLIPHWCVSTLTIENTLTKYIYKAALSVKKT